VRPIGTLLAVLCVGASLHAQAAPDKPAIVVGNVIEDTDSAVVGATVELVGMARARTDSAGIFRFRDVPVGSHILRAARLGYAPSIQIVTLKPNDTLVVTIILQRSAYALAPVEIKADSEITPRTDPTGFLWRKKGGMGVYFDALDIEKRHAPDVQHLMQGISGVYVVNGGIRIARESQSFRSPCYGAQVMLDGVPMASGFDLNALPISAIRGIEVYKSVATIPAELRTSKNTCGVVAIWTR